MEARVVGNFTFRDEASDHAQGDPLVDAHYHEHSRLFFLRELDDPVPAVEDPAVFRSDREVDVLFFLRPQQKSSTLALVAEIGDLLGLVQKGVSESAAHAIDLLALESLANLLTHQLEEEGEPTVCADRIAETDVSVSAIEIEGRRVISASLLLMSASITAGLTVLDPVEVTSNMAADHDQAPFSHWVAETGK